MSQGSLHSLFERLFGNADDAPKGNEHARHTAHLASGFDAQRGSGHGELADNPEHSTALMAAYLDGGLNETAQQDIHARLAQSPAALHDLDSADAFLSAITQEPQIAPADLVASVIARNRPTASVSKVAQKRIPVFWQWSGALVGLAVAVVAAVIILNRQSLPTDVTTPIIAKSAQPQTPATAGKDASSSQPAMLPAGAEITVPTSKNCNVASPDQAKGNSPAPCPKTEAGTILAPAASKSVMPSSHPQKPTMVPEGMDRMPGATQPR